MQVMHFRTTALLSFDKLRTTGQRIETKKLLLAMKLTAIILFAACLQVSARGDAQTVSISVKNASLEKVFQEIKKQTGYKFFYEGGILDEAKTVNVSVKNASIEDVLNLCFKDQPLTYTIIEKTILIKRKATDPNADATNVDAQPLIDVSGKVTSETGEPLSGATVKVKGSNKGTTTGTDGVFILRGVDGDAVLEISFVGYTALTIEVNRRSSITASLKLNPSPLDEMQVIAYGTKSKRLQIGDVTTVKAEDIQKQPVQNVLLALQARVPGLIVMQPSGLAGTSVKVRIQGENSIAHGNDPLYIVDGVPIDAQMPGTGLGGILALAGANYAPGPNYSGEGNPINYLNPLDIESIEVLKDADATAIYGSRAANGAILITTKKGKAGAMRLDLDMQTGWGKMTRRLDMLNTRQYLDMRYEAFANDGIDWKSPSVSANDLKVWDTTRYTNWQDEILGGTAHYNNINASVSGGSNTVRYLVSGTWHKETTVFPLPKDFADEKGSVHFNLNANNATNKFKLQFSGNFMADKNQLPNVDMTQNALLLEPDAPALLNNNRSINWSPDANGNTTWGNADPNVMIWQYRKYVNKTYNLVSNLGLGYTILPGLEIRSSFGYNYMQTDDYAPNPLIAVAPELRPTTRRSASFGNRNIQSWVIEPQASYNKRISMGKLELLIGSTFQQRKIEAGYVTGTGQLSDELLGEINSAATISKGFSSNSSYRYNAVFGRANYNWSEKYIFNINTRRDGSTRFGGDNRFHNFGSVGGAWIFSNERVFKSFAGTISFGKLRGSYGTTGSDQIGDYQFMSLYNLFGNAPVPYQGVTALVPGGLPNPNLGWEETKKLQIGMDLGFLQDRIILNATFIRNRSSNQLLTYSLPSIAGIGGYITNFPATIQNRNFEFAVTGKILQKKNLGWTVNANLTIPQNRVVSFPYLSSSTYANLIFIGYPMDAIGYYTWRRVDPSTGDYLYLDSKGTLTTTPNAANDRILLVSKYPKFYGGLQNSITYKNIELDFLFQLVKQDGYNDIAFWNGIRYPGMFTAGFSNQPTRILDRWQKPGDYKTVARYSTYSLDDRVIGSNRRFSDASYIRLKNFSLSWDLSQKWVDKAHFRNFRVYVHGQNLFTLTNYKGLDPETKSLTVLPPLQIWTFGLQMGL
jgi:TonB-linked SusC/RagA family outer membrane protein